MLTYNFFILLFGIIICLNQATAIDNQNNNNSLLTIDNNYITTESLQTKINDILNTHDKESLIRKTNEILEMLLFIVDANDTNQNKKLTNQIAQIIEIINSLQHEELLANISFIVGVTEYLSFLGIIMLSYANGNIPPNFLRSTIPLPCEENNNSLSNSLNTKFDIAHLEELIEKINEDIENRLDSLDHPDKANIRVILKKRRSALLEHYHRITAAHKYKHQHSFNQSAVGTVSIIFSLIIGGGLLLSTIDTDEGFKRPSIAQLKKNITTCINQFS